MRTKKLSRTVDYRITEAMGHSNLIGKKVRILLNDKEEDIPLDREGFMLDLQGYMLSGSQAGSVVELPPCKLRYAAMTKCHCEAYPFPHAPGFGPCKQPKFEQTSPEGMKLEDLFQ